MVPPAASVHEPTCRLTDMQIPRPTSSWRDLPLEGQSGNPHLHSSQASLRNAGLGVPPVSVPINVPESGLSKAGDQSGWERFQG